MFYYDNFDITSGISIEFDRNQMGLKTITSCDLNFKLNHGIKNLNCTHYDNSSKSKTLKTIKNKLKENKNASNTKIKRKHVNNGVCSGIYQRPIVKAKSVVSNKIKNKGKLIKYSRQLSNNALKPLFDNPKCENILKSTIRIPYCLEDRCMDNAETFNNKEIDRLNIKDSTECYWKYNVNFIDNCIYLCTVPSIKLIQLSNYVIYKDFFKLSTLKLILYNHLSKTGLNTLHSEKSQKYNKKCSKKSQYKVKLNRKSIHRIYSLLLHIQKQNNKIINFIDTF